MRVSAGRLALERVLRGAALSLLVLLLWRLAPRAPEGPAESGARVLDGLAMATDSSGAATARRLLALMLRDSAIQVAATLPTVPSRDVRGAVAAARAAGARFTWRDSTGARGLAIDAFAAPDPAGRTVVAATIARAPVVLRDNGGTLDSIGPLQRADRVVADSMGVRSGVDGIAEGAVDASTNGKRPANGTVGAPTELRILVRRGARYFEVQHGTSTARIAAPAAAVTKRIMLYARPGWEAKFTAAALEELGWSVDATLPISPRTQVTLGAPMALDTGRYSAAIVIDSGVARSAVLARFVDAGGGVILSGDAMRDASLTSLSPARVASVRIGIPGGLRSPDPRSGLDTYVLAPMRDAVVIQNDGSEASSVARTPFVIAMRRGAGRVVAVGYRNSWRWRMEGEAGSEDEHRAFWASLLRTVAFAPTPVAIASGVSLRDRGSVASVSSASVDNAGADFYNDAAPYADLVARLGAADTSPVTPASGGSSAIASARQFAGGRDLGGSSLPWNMLLGALTMALLTAEWTSRRLRGAR